MCLNFNSAFLGRYLHSGTFHPGNYSAITISVYVNDSNTTWCFVITKLNCCSSSWDKLVKVTTTLQRIGYWLLTSCCVSVCLISWEVNYTSSNAVCCATTAVPLCAWEAVVCAFEAELVAYFEGVEVWALVEHIAHICYICCIEVSYV